MFVESVSLNHLINFQTSPFPKRLVITHTKTIYLCQNLRNIHIGFFFFKSIFLSNVLRHNKQRGTFMIYYNVS